MNFPIFIVIFIVTLVVYSCVMNQHCKSQDMEMYELDYLDNANIQDTCHAGKQPVVFKLDHLEPKLFNDLNLAKFMSNEHVNVKDINDYYTDVPDAVTHVSLPFKSAMTLMTTDTAAKYFSDGNAAYIEESDVELHIFDEYLKPKYTVNTNHDLLFGSKDARTPLKYHVNHRKFLVVTTETVTIKMTPWKSTKYLHEYQDYENFEFRSKINVDAPQTPKYTQDIAQTAFLEFEVNAGYALYIPPYWWYSVKFAENSCAVECNYNSVVSYLANAPRLVKYYMQLQNITTKIKKNADVVVVDEPVGEFDQL